MSHEKQFTSASFLIFLSNIKKLDLLNLYWPLNEEERQSPSPQYDFLWKQEIPIEISP